MKMLSFAAIIGRLCVNSWTQGHQFYQMVQMVQHGFVFWKTGMITLFITPSIEFMMFIEYAGIFMVNVCAFCQADFKFIWWRRAPPVSCLCSSANTAAGWSILVWLRTMTLDFLLDGYNMITAAGGVGMGNFKLRPEICMALFALLMPIYIQIAVSAFQVKINSMQGDQNFWRFCSFANQLISLTSLSQIKYNQTRLVLFGGSDAVLQPDEQEIAVEFEREAYSAINQADLPLWKKIIIFMTFDSGDLQKLYVGGRESVEGRTNTM
jgi:hypothetical protein